MKELKLKIKLQPWMQCGPACLKAVLNYYGIDVVIKKLIRESSSKYKWHDWDFRMGISALKRGLQSTIHTNSIAVFDQSWEKLSQNLLKKKLKQELKYVQSARKKKKRRVSWSYTTFTYEEHELKAALEFIENGGKIGLGIYTKDTIQKYVSKNIPIICAVNQTHLHGKRRLHKGQFDDIRGVSCGHIIIVIGYSTKKFKIADPGIEYNKQHYYWIDKDRFMDSIIRFDGNLIAISK